MPNIIDISVDGLSATLYQTYKGMDRWSLQIGGFYNWHCPLNEAVDKAEKVMKDVLARRVEIKMRGVRRALRKKAGNSSVTAYEEIINS